MTRREWVALAAVFSVAIGARLLFIGSPLLDAQACRQTDTASIARGFATLDFDLLRPRLDFGIGAPVVELEFQLYTGIVAALYRVFGVHEVIGRLVSLAFGLVALAYLFRLGCRWLPPIGAWTSAALFAISPLATLFGRNVQPDMAMLACSVGAIFHLDRHLFAEGRPLRRDLFLAGTFIALAILLKATAALLFVPAGYLWWRRHGLGALARGRFWIFAGVATVPGAAWYAHAHSLYLESGITFLLGYNRNKLAEPQVFLDPHYWRVLFLDRPVRLQFTFLGFAALLAGLIPWRGWSAFGTAGRSDPAAGPPGREGIVLVWLLAVVAFFLAVAKGNLVHNHYQLPILGPGCLLVGAGAVRLAAAGAFATPARIACALVLALASVIQGAASVSPQYRYSRDVLACGRTAAAASRPGDRVVAVGAEYNTLLYYAGRPGWAFWDGAQLASTGLAPLVAEGATLVAWVHREDLAQSPLARELEAWRTLGEGRDWIVLRRP